jgi:hypothetical protein
MLTYSPPKTVIIFKKASYVIINNSSGLGILTQKMFFGSQWGLMNQNINFETELAQGFTFSIETILLVFPATGPTDLN